MTESDNSPHSITPSSAIKQQFEDLRQRIKHTSSVRFYASRRVQSDYKIAQLTVVILSLWTILISYLLSNSMAKNLNFNIELLTAVGVILPVFIVVFSLLENEESYLRSHKLEISARQLRELADQLYTAAAVKDLSADNILIVYDGFSQRYSDCLERWPVNHENIDHYRKLSRDSWKKSKYESNESIKINLKSIFVFIKKVMIYLYFISIAQTKRMLYIFSWFTPISVFYL